MPTHRFERRTLALIALLAVFFCRSTASASNALSFPATEFTILDPRTNFAMGRGRYSIKSIPGGAILQGTNRYDTGSSDVETARIETAPDGSARLVEADHTFFKIDGSIMQRSHIDMKAGDGTCVNNTLDPKIEETDPILIPPDTWSGASVLIPIQRFLREGVTETQHLHVFNCAPTPKIFAIKVKFDRAAQLWPPYSADAFQVEVRPDFGWINILIAPFVPKLHAWFDPLDDWNFVGSEAARFYKGPPIMLVKTRGSPTTQAKQ
ncbi:MAG: hypothetical protein Q7S58_21140 [Candidatus Binatus sp.]|uniref:hypothetical protein n=1 Tax=Candidatus Binatus sp. TaxID=2811406 RepID=UPI00271E5585|nr:hypothetical protein [Candidatus Binatus sp.]MDO8434913.1 hypothetical protein [Candidatus Binatus sp.]